MRISGARAEVWLAGVRGITPAIAWRRFAARWVTSPGLAALLDAEQDRWILWVPVFAGVGIGLYFSLPFEPGWALAAAFLIAAAGLRLSFRRGVVALAITGALASSALGLAAAKFRSDLMAGPIVGVSKQIWAVHGWVELVEKRPAKGVRLTLRVSSIEGLAPGETPLRVRVTSPYGNVGVHAGDAVVVKAALQPPPAPAEPDGYDFARASWFAGVGGVGFSLGRPMADGSAPAMPAWTVVKTTVERMREGVSERIAAALPGPTGAITDALVTGEHEAIPEPMTDVLRDSGLAHILAISGLKLTIMAGALFGLTRLLLAAFPAVALNWPVKKIASGAGLAGATFYLLISGCGAATTRAYVMIAIGLIAMLLDRPALSMRNLAIAALCLILPQPETILDPSFQMSFSAVVALMTAYEWARDWRLDSESAAYHKRKRRQKLTGWRAWVAWGLSRTGHILRETIAATTIATIAIAPYTVYTFHRVAVYGILANFVAVPLFNVVIMPLVALALAAMPFGLESWPLTLVDRWVEVLMWIARSVSGLPGAVILVPQMPVWALAVMTLGAAWLCLWRRGWRYLGLAGVALGILLAARGQAPDILIGAEGHPIAVRLADGRLSGLPARSGTFELTQWLQADADGRDPAAIETGAGFRCDGLGCTALVRGEIVAISDTPASLRDDCANAKIVILRYRQPGPCVGPALVVDIRDLRLGGVEAVTLTKSGVRTANVAGERGDRPWSRMAARYVRSSELDDIATPGWQRTAPPAAAHKKRPGIGPNGKPAVLAASVPGAAAAPVPASPKRHKAHKTTGSPVTAAAPAGAVIPGAASSPAKAQAAALGSAPAVNSATGGPSSVNPVPEAASPPGTAGRRTLVEQTKDQPAPAPTQPRPSGNDVALQLPVLRPEWRTRLASSI